MTFDPIASPTVTVADDREPQFVHDDQEQAADGRARRVPGARTGAAPNVLVDPHGRRRLGRLRLLRRRRRGRRADAEHRPARPRGPAADVVLLRAVVHAVAGVAADRPAADAPRPAAPADVRRARRAAGRDHRSPSCSPTPATSPRPSASGTWARTSSRSPSTSASTTSTASSRVSDMYTEWRDPYFFPEVVYSEARTEWIENMPFNKCFVHADAGRRRSRTVEEVTIPVLSLLDDKWADYSIDFIRRMAGEEQPWFLYHCTRGAHFDNYPHERFLGVVTGQAPVQGHDHRARRHRRPARRRRCDETGPARGHAHLRLVGQRAGDGDVARRRVHAVPLRQGLDVGGRRAGARRSLSWPGMIEAGPRVATACSRSPTCSPTMLRARRAPTTRCPTTASSTASTRRRSCSRPTALSNRKYHYYWLGQMFSALRVGEYKFMLGVDLRRRPRRAEPRRLHRRRRRSTPTGGSTTSTSTRRRRAAT